MREAGLFMPDDIVHTAGYFIDTVIVERDRTRLDTEATPRAFQFHQVDHPIRAICLQDRTITTDSECDHPDRADYQNFLAFLLTERWNESKGPGDITEAVASLKSALEYTRKVYPNRLNTLRNMAQMLELHEDQEADDDCGLGVSITTTQEILELTPDDDENRVGRSRALMLLSARRFQSRQDAADVEIMINAARDIGQSSFAKDDARVECWMYLAQALGVRYQMKGNLADIEEAISVIQSAIESLPDDSEYVVITSEPGNDSLGGPLNACIALLERLLKVQEQGKSETVER